MKNSISRSKWLATTAILSAMASILMFLELPVPLMPAFIKLDFSLLPCIIANIALGPLSGVVATTIKELIHLMLHGASSTGGIGNLADYATCLCVVIPSGFIYKFKPNLTGLSIGLAVGSVCSALLSGLVFNALVVYPLYDKFILPMQAIISMYQAIRPSASGLWEVLAIFNVPFTLLKCVIISILAVIIAKPLSKYLIRKGSQDVPD